MAEFVFLAVCWSITGACLMLTAINIRKIRAHRRAADWYRSWRTRPFDAPKPSYVVRSERWRRG